MTGGLLVLLVAGLMMLEHGTASDGDSVFAAAAVKARQNAESGGKDDPYLGRAKKGKGPGKGQLVDWAKKLRGQMPGKFDDKAAKKIFDSVAAAGPQKLKLSVDEYKAKGWHYQLKGDDTAEATPGDSASSSVEETRKAGALKSAYGYGSVSSSNDAKNEKANRSPVDVKDPETIKKDEEKYLKAKSWREQMDAKRKVRRRRLLSVQASRCPLSVCSVRRCVWCPHNLSAARRSLSKAETIRPSSRPRSAMISGSMTRSRLKSGKRSRRCRASMMQLQQGSSRNPPWRGSKELLQRARTSSASTRTKSAPCERCGDCASCAAALCSASFAVSLHRAASINILRHAVRGVCRA